MGNSFQILAAASWKACVPELSLVKFYELMTCCEIYELSCLGIFERRRRLDTYGGCCYYEGLVESDY